MQYTTNYGLTKLELSDSPADITEINDNWESIDEKLKEHADMLDGTTGSIAFTDEENTFTKPNTFSGTTPYINFSNQNLTKGTNPDSTVYQTIYFRDKTNSNNAILGFIQNAVQNNGNVISKFAAYANVADSSDKGEIGITANKDGSATGFAPTPPVSSNTNEIATTEWVRDRIPELAPEPDLSAYVKKVNNVAPDKNGNVTLDMPDDSSIKQLVLNTFFPVGSIYMDATGKINPNTQFGGTWVKIENRFLYGQGTKSIGATGGAETVSLDGSQMPAHSHTRGEMNITGTAGTAGDFSLINSGGEVTGAFYRGTTRTYQISGNTYNRNSNDLALSAANNWTGTTSVAGSGVAHENMPPYIVVAIWKRTA